MPDFINTIDILGDDVVTDSIIDGTITEFADNIITTLGSSAFASCISLTRIDLPEVTTVQGVRQFEGCVNLVDVNLPKLTGLSLYCFNGCGKYGTLRLPSATDAGTNMSLGTFREVDLPVCTNIGDKVFYNSNFCRVLMLRSDTKCVIGDSAFPSDKKNYDLLNILVPSALINEYKADANLSWCIDRIYPVEDYTIDGSVRGDVVLHYVDNMTINVATTNTRAIWSSRNYTATLSPTDGNPITYTRVYMGDDDITSTAYNSQTHTINIPEVTGNIRIIAHTREVKGDVLIVGKPAIGEEGNIVFQATEIKKGDKIEVAYNLTKNGQAYNGVNCGLGRVYSGNTGGLEKVVTKTATSDGYLLISGHENEYGVVPNGNFTAHNACMSVGKYIIVTRLWE